MAKKKILGFGTIAIECAIAGYLAILRHEEVTIMDLWFLHIETIKK